MKYINFLSRLNKQSLTLLLCLLLITGMFVYTIQNRIYQVTAINSKQYHKAVETYLNSEAYYKDEQ